MTVKFELSEINKIASQILEQNPHKVIVFNGNMGAGKTTFINALCRNLGVLGNTSSPTFSLVNEYQGTTDIIYHFDVYRLKTESEALDFGIEEYLYSGNWCFVEWSEKIPNLLPKQYSTITIAETKNGLRTLTLI